MFQKPGGDDRARHDGEQGEGEQGDEDGQKIELEEAVGFGFVVDQIKSCQQGLETTVCGVAADHQSQGALSRDGARRGMGQALDFIDEDGACGVRQNIGQCSRLLADLPDRQDRLVKADQDGDGGEERQQGEKGHAAGIEHDVTPPAASEGAHRQATPEQGLGQ